MRQPKSNGGSNIFSDPLRHICAACKTKLVPCVRITDGGVVGKVIAGCFCVNVACFRYVDLRTSTVWVRAEKGAVSVDTGAVE